MDLSQIPISSVPMIGSVGALIWVLIYIFRSLLPHILLQEREAREILERAHTANEALLRAAIDAQTKQLEALTDQTKALTEEFRRFIETQPRPALATSGGFNQASLGSMVRAQLKTDDGDEAAANLIVALSKKLGLEAV